MRLVAAIDVPAVSVDSRHHGYCHGLLGYSHARRGRRGRAGAWQAQRAAAMDQIAATADRRRCARTRSCWPWRCRPAASPSPTTASPATARAAPAASAIPALADDVWLWGGKLADIQTTITHGIRSGDPDARSSQMPRFGADGMLKPEQIQQVADYVDDAVRQGEAGHRLSRRARQSSPTIAPPATATRARATASSARRR